MFLQRNTSTTSFSSFRTNDSSFSRPRLVSTSSIGWSNPSIAADSVSVTAQLQSSYLASQHLSHHNKGPAPASSQASTSAAPATHDRKSRRPEDLRVVSDTHVKDREESEQHPQPQAHTLGRHVSKRGHAKQRIKAQETLEDVIGTATDTGRLKWEAKAAILSGAPTLAVIILTRAASLGSVSACISLTALYTTGVVKGRHPIVTLVHRDPLSALAWLLEGARLLRRRREKNRAKAAWSSARRTVPMQRAASEREALDQVVRILALLERLLRTRQVSSDLAQTESSNSQDELLLPDSHAMQAPLQTGSLRFAPRPALSSFAPQMQLWPSVLEARLWLETELEFMSAGTSSETPRLAPTPSNSSKPISLSAANSHILFIKAFAQTHSLCKNGLPAEKEIDSLATSWGTAKQSLASVLESDRTELRAVSALGHTLIDELRRLSQQSTTEQVKQAGSSFWASLEGTLPESDVSTQTHHKSTSTPEEALAHYNATIRSGPGNPLLKHSLQVSSSKDVKSAQAESPARDRSESTSPVTTQTRHKQPHSPRKYLTRTVSDVQKPSTSLLEVSSTRSKGAEPSPSYMHHFGGRTISGSKLDTPAKRPSSVVSDSPSLLFGADEVDPSISAQTAQRGDGTSRAFPSSASVSHGMNDQSNRGLAPRRPGSGFRGGPRRVTSMYGAPSLSAQPIHTSGMSSSAYGHVGASGVFDPTASLREGQYRRRRADSNASVATAASIFSTQAKHDGQSFLPPDGHAMGTMATTSGTLSGGMVASSSLRSNLAGGAMDGNANPTEDGPDSATPLLTERLERKLAESYASQRQPSYLGYRKDTNSISSRMSNTSRRTGLSAFRSPSFFAPSGSKGSQYYLGIFPKTATKPSLATTAESVEQHSAVSAPPPASNAKGQAGRIGTPPALSQEAGSKSALNTLRALNLNDATAKAAKSQRAASATSSKRLPIPEFDNSRSGLSSPKALSSKSRAFSSVDPTSQGYADGASPVDAAEGSKASLVPSRTLTASPKPSIRSAHSPRRVSPPGSVRSVRFDLPEIDPLLEETKQLSRAGSRTTSPPQSPRPHSHRSGHSSDLDPALARAEGRSKLKTQAGCENCGVLCVNAPVDRKGRKFCSRECRMEVKQQDKDQQLDQGLASSSISSSAAAAPQQTQTQTLLASPIKDTSSLRSSRSGGDEYSTVRSVRSIAASSMTGPPHSPKAVAA